MCQMDHTCQMEHRLDTKLFYSDSALQRLFVYGATCNTCLRFERVDSTRCDGIPLSAKTWSG